MLALIVFVLGTVGIATALGIRIRSAHEVQRSLIAYKLQLPASLSTDDVATWLGMVATATGAPRWSLRSSVPVLLELVASFAGIEHFVLVPRSRQQQVLSNLRAGLPGARMTEAPNYQAHSPQFRAATELRLTTSRRPLAIERAEAVTTALLAALQPLAHGEEIRINWSLCRAGTPPPVPSTTRRNDSALSNLFDGRDDLDSDQVRAQRRKDSEPLLWASIRIGASSSSNKRARALLASIVSTLRGMDAPGVRVVRSHTPSGIVAKRLAAHSLPITRWPLLLNTRELSGLIGFPIGELSLPGLSVHTSRQLPPSSTSTRLQVVLAASNYPGTNKRIGLSTADRLKHLWLLGPTGTGKSTLIASMALQDAAAGHGFVIIDPKNDLVEDVLARLPGSRHDDVIVLDPTAYANSQPIVGFNLLGHARTDAERELVTDHIVHIMSSIWAESWGPRTSDVLRNALLTLTHTKAADGSAFTLIEVAELLTNPSFRRFVTNQPSVPEAVRPFWTAYESYSEAQKLQVTGPSLNKLRAMSTRSSLRLMLGQSEGLNVADVLNNGKILLVPLSKGTIGVDTAQLLGSLIVAALANATFGRAAIPASKRRPAWVYLDEFQDVLRLDLDVADLLAQARGLGVGLIMANQYLGQLPDSIKRAVLGTVRSSVSFQLDYDDAKVLERRFAPLTASELQHLPPYEVALRLCENNTTGRPVTGITLPLAEPDADGSALAEASAKRYGQTRSDVEAAIRTRIAPKQFATADGTTGPSAPFGRRKLGGNQ